MLIAVRAESLNCVEDVGEVMLPKPDQEPTGVRWPDARERRSVCRQNRAVLLSKNFFLGLHLITSLIASTASLAVPLIGAMCSNLSVTPGSGKENFP